MRLSKLCQEVCRIIYAQVSPLLFAWLSHSGHSTANISIIFSLHVTPALDEGLQVDAACVNFRKTFDAIGHDFRLEKLAATRKL